MNITLKCAPCEKKRQERLTREAAAKAQQASTTAAVNAPKAATA